MIWLTFFAAALASGTRIHGSLLGSRAILPALFRNWPATSSTLSPSGKRGVTTSLRKRRNSASVTVPSPLMLRPK